VKDEKGFTLIEVLVALLILAGVSVILYQSGSLLAVRKGRLYNTVTLLLQKKAVEFEVENKKKSVDEIKEQDSGDFGEGYPEFSWEIKLKPFTVPPILPKQANGDNENQLADIIMKTMADYFEKAVREVSITVIYKNGERSQKWSLSTIYIDYKQEIPSGI